MCYWDIFALIHISIFIAFIFIWRSPIHVLISSISSHSFSFAILVFFEFIRYATLLFFYFLFLFIIRTF
jgi:hypothetical protein